MEIGDGCEIDQGLGKRGRDGARWCEMLMVVVVH